ncbi:MAG TPA: STAS domain-containing protein [Stenomitos sp.]
MQIDVETTHDGSCVRLRGDLDAAAARAFDAQLEALVPELHANVTLDLSGLTCLDSQGLKAFLRLDKLLKAGGKAFVLRGAAPFIFRIFRYCGLDTYFRFVEPQGLRAESGG